MVSVVENDHGYPSSNPVREFLHIANTLGKTCESSYLPSSYRYIVGAV